MIYQFQLVNPLKDGLGLKVIRFRFILIHFFIYFKAYRCLNKKEG